MLKLLTYPGVHSRCYYCIEGEEVIRHHTFPYAIAEVGRMISFNNLNETCVVFIEIKGLETAATTLMDEISYMD